MANGNDVTLTVCQVLDANGTFHFEAASPEWLGKGGAKVGQVYEFTLKDLAKELAAFDAVDELLPSSLLSDLISTAFTAGYDAAKGE